MPKSCLPQYLDIERGLASSVAGFSGEDLDRHGEGGCWCSLWSRSIGAGTAHHHIQLAAFV